ncbi:glycosyltransferase family 4 protein [Leucobacter sp. GX24907]
MRVAITSRIFEPEPSAASFRLGALARTLTAAGHEATVLTVKPPKGTPNADSERRYRVRRFPVLRDSTGYVRGYVQYMSFDIPLFFRILCGPKRDLVITEPPPTTGFFVRLACAMRRTPYAYYAADVWSDAAESTGASGLVVSVVRRMERFALSGARAVLSVNAGVSDRVREIAPAALVHTIGNGIDTAVFTADGPIQDDAPYLIYSGTASEWQGAAIFIDALERVLPQHPGIKLVFLGQGSDWPALQEHAARLPEGAVEFVATVPPEVAAAWIRGAVASVASIRPDAGYDFAFPTKVFASWAVGTPVVFAGEGPVRIFIDEHATEAALGEGCRYDAEAVAKALGRLLAAAPSSKQRTATAEWASENVSLDAVAERAVRILTEEGPQ